MATLYGERPHDERVWYSSPYDFIADWEVNMLSYPQSLKNANHKRHRAEFTEAGRATKMASPPLNTLKEKKTKEATHTQDNKQNKHRQDKQTRQTRQQTKPKQTTQKDKTTNKTKRDRTKHTQGQTREHQTNKGKPKCGGGGAVVAL